MTGARPAWLTSGIALVGAGVIAVGPAAPMRADVRLASADEELGASTALIPGASFVATPSQGWLDAFDRLYLQPHGFSGATVPVTTPESLYPFTGPFSMTMDASVAQGEQIIAKAIEHQIAAGDVSPNHPIVITGYSQSSTIDSLLMRTLGADGINPNDLRFALLGDPNNPDGGFLERFAVPNSTPVDATSLGLTFSGPTPADVSPTDIYTYEYDGFADFPKYPIDLLADLNAYMGIVFNHLAYLGLTPQQLSPVADGGSLVALPTAAGSLTDYYMIESASLPLLDPLRLIPIIGDPLADLLQPDLSVLVNLGYGDISNGWSPGDAGIPTTMGWLPSLSVLDKVPDALWTGLQLGVKDAVADLLAPSNYQLISTETMTDVVGPLWRSATAAFDLDGTHHEVSNYLSTFLSGVQNWFTGGLDEVSLTHTGLPALDMGSSLLFTLPEIGVQLFDTEMAADNPIEAIGEPLAALVGLAPLMLVGAIF